MEFLNFVVLVIEGYFRFIFTVNFGGISVGNFLLATVILCMFLRFAFGGLWESLYGGDN